MRHTKRIILLLLSILLTVPVVGCSSGEEAEPSDGSVPYTVTRGNLALEVSASGNLGFSNLEDLAFEMAGTVQDVFVEEGGAVTQGQVVATLDTTDWEKQLRSLRISVLSAEISLRQSKQSLEDAKEETQTTITGDVVVNCCPDAEEVRIKEMQLEQAELRLDDATAALEEHLGQSPEVVAPFDGFVTKVTAEGGDEVFKGSVAVTIVDPNRFEASIYVSENDIALVRVSTEAEVSVDSMSGVVLPATVTAVAPTATISSGVVNYEVTVQVASLEDMQTAMQEARTQAAARQQPASDDMADRLSEAVEAGETTEEEAAAIAERMQSGGFPQGASAQAAALADIQLREGLSVSVTLLIAERANVILAPNAAIGRSGGTSYVTVLNEDGSAEQRTITTGISDWQFTEVTDGLAEGEIIRTFGSTDTASTPDRGNGMFMMGGPPRQ